MKKKSKKADYSKYENVPSDKLERLVYVKNLLSISKKDEMLVEEIKEQIKNIKKRTKKTCRLTFYIVPEGISRPRSGKYGFYVPNIKKFYDCMNEYLKSHSELNNLNIISECKMDLKYYLPIPSDMRKIEKYLAELKIIKSIKKPDWDNLGKSTDMLSKLWIDDSIANDVRVRKFYSFKPRIEVRILYYTTNTNSYHELCIKKMKKHLEKINK